MRNKELLKKIDEKEAAFKKLVAEYQEISGARKEIKGSPEEVKEMLEMTMERMDRLASNLFREVDFVAEMLFDFMREHTKNHAPHPQTVSQMNSALEAFDMDRDFEVEKRTITMSAARGRKVIEVG